MGIAFFGWLIIAASCSNKKVPSPEILIAKTVPLNFILDTDSNFSNHQDTIYYKQHYFSGFQYSLFNKGDTAYLKSYFNGVEEGTQKKWYPNKQLAEQRFFINGKNEGLQQAWWTNGKQKFIYHFADGLFDGELKEWNVEGQINRQFNYLAGQEEGSQKMWWDNGTIRANYVIKSGKKYGLIGLKLCNNPYDSLTKK